MTKMLQQNSKLLLLLHHFIHGSEAHKLIENLTSQIYKIDD